MESKIHLCRGRKNSGEYLRIAKTSIILLGTEIN